MSSTGPAGGDGGPDEFVVRLGEVGLGEGLADVRWMLHDALRAGARRIVVDLDGVPALASPALASFLWAHRACRARGGALVLRGPDRRTRDMLRRTGLRQVLRVQSSGSRDAA